MSRREKDIERRYVVSSYDPETLRSPKERIEQGYLVNMPGYILRIRIVDGERAILARKYGSGLEREAVTKDIDLDTGRFLLGSSPYTLEKTRYFRDGWRFDVFEGPLAGLVLAEFEMEDTAQEVTLPPWIHKAKEVTDSLTNLHLARLARDLEDGDEGAIRDRLPRHLPKIILTGGPCSGKSSAMAALRKEMGGLLHCVPEVATIVIAQVGISPPFDDRFALRKFQQTIYRVQQSFEEASETCAAREGKKALLLDRGSVDNAAYLPDGLGELERICRTERGHEYARYDLVLCLDVPPEDVFEHQRANNPARTETYDAAKDLGDRIKEVWRGHPKFMVITDYPTWEEKLGVIRAAVHGLIDD